MKILNILSKVLISLGTGRFLQDMRVDRVLSLIIFGFILAWLTIVVRLKVEYKMHEVEKNKKILKELKIEHAQKTIELDSFNRTSKIEELLHKNGSSLKRASKPAYIIE